MEITWKLHQRKLGFQGELYKLAEKASSERSQQRGDQENQVFQLVAKYTGRIRKPFFLMGNVFVLFHPQYPHRSRVTNSKNRRANHLQNLGCTSKQSTALYGPIGFIP